MGNRFFRFTTQSNKALQLSGATELVGEMQYEDTYRLAYIRGPEGIIVALSEQLG